MPFDAAERTFKRYKVDFTEDIYFVSAYGISTMTNTPISLCCNDINSTADITSFNINYGGMHGIHMGKYVQASYSGKRL